MSESTVEQPPGLQLASILLVGVLSISTGGVFIVLAGEAPSLVIAAYRVGLAVVLLLPFTWWWARDEWRDLALSQYLWALGSGFFLALHFATWISSLEYTTVANSVVLVNTNPLWVALLTPFLGTDKLTPTTVVGVVLTVAGCVVVGWGDWNLSSEALWGDFLALLGSIAASLYILIGRRLRRDLSFLTYTTLCYGLAAVFLWIAVAVEGLAVTGYSVQTWSIFLALALVPQILGHGSYNWALKYMSASLIAVALLGEPILSSLLAWLVLDQTLTSATLWGGGLILVGIYITVRDEGERIRRAREVPETLHEER